MMKRLLPILASLAFLPAPMRAGEKPSISPAPQTNTPAVEICFVLDTTGSMGGLIAAAKRKIWSIANEVVAVKPKEIRFGLIGYRDRGDQYITKQIKLTDDLDAIHTELTSFVAAGGGDGPESVNQALIEAVREMNWSDNPKVRKLIFLVGDAPPHMDYKQEVQYPEACRLAITKGISINAILCGSDPNTASIWQEISAQGKGYYAAIPQKGGALAVTTPFDNELRKLSIALNDTVASWGSDAQRGAYNSKLKAINEAPAETQATRAGYALKNYKSGQVVSGKGDLVNDWAEGSVKLEDLKPEQLEGDLKGLKGDALKAKLEEKKAAREKLQKKVSELTRKRNTFIEEQHKKTKEPKDSFDAKINEMLKKQLTPAAK